MANTYTQCYFHLVFSVKNRDALIRRDWKDELEMPCYKYDAAPPHSRYVNTLTNVAWCRAPLIFVGAAHRNITGK